MTKEKILQVVTGISITIATATFGWAWNLNADIAVMQNDIETIEENRLKDANSQETAHEVLQNWSSFKSTQEGHTKQLGKLWGHLNTAQAKEVESMQRLARIEAEVKYCCE